MEAADTSAGDILPADTTTPDITITVEDERWTAALGDDPAAAMLDVLCTTLVRAGDPSLMQGAGCTLGVTLADDDSVRTLNRDYRGRDKATNILSFAQLDGEKMPLPDGAPLELGDLVLAYETVAREAELQSKTFRHHFIHLIVHGVLHLLGHDHINEGEAEEMEALERDILQRFGIADPYDPEGNPGTDPATYAEDTPTAGPAGGTP